MKKINTLFVLSAAALVSVCALTGCGGGKKERTGDKFKVSIAITEEKGEKAVMEALKTAYEAKNPDVEIEIKTFGKWTTSYEYLNSLNKARDQLPDMVWTCDDQFAAHAYGGWFEDLRPYYEQSTDTAYENYYDTMLKAASYTGEYKLTSVSSDAKYGLYYAPRDYNKPAIVVNKALIKELNDKFGFNITLPDTTSGWTVEAFYAFLQECEQALSLAANGRGEEGDDNYIEPERKFASYRTIHMLLNWEPVYYTLLTNLGSDGILTSDNKLNIGSAKNKAAIASLYDNLSTKEMMIDVDGNFNKGLTIMEIVSRPLIVNAAASLGNGDKDKSNLDFLPMPGDMVAAGNSGYAILKQHSNETMTVKGETKTVKDVCWDFLKFIITTEGQEAGSATGLVVPVLKSLESTGCWTKWLESHNMNHSAWVAGEELALDVYRVFEPQIRPDLRNLVNQFFNNLQSKTVLSPEKRDEAINKLISDFNREAAKNKSDWNK